MSRPSHPSGIASAGTVRVSASAANASATTTSVGRTILPDSSSERQVPIWSDSSRDLPTPRPCAARKVKHMPPPTSSASTFGSSASITASLSETFDPPSTTDVGPLRRAGELAQHVDLGEHEPTRVGGEALAPRRRPTPASGAPPRSRRRRTRRPRRPARPARRPAHPARPRPCWSRAGRSGCSRRSTTSPDAICGGPAASWMTRTGADSSSESRAATGAREYFGSGTALRTAQVRGQNHPGARLGQVLDRRQRGSDAAVVGDRLTVQGDVQIDAHQHAAVPDPLLEQVVQGLHSFDATRPVMSTRRLE